MATIPTPQEASVGSAETVEGRFRRLEALWTEETGYLSSYSEIVAHPAFREIVGLGTALVPLMLHDLEERPRLWVWALPEITGETRVPGDAGNIRKMSEVWLSWGRAKRYRW